MLGIIDIIRYLRLIILHLLYRCRPELSLMDNTVIIAPHPDDEVIGCAGLIQALVEQGTPPHVIILTGGEGSHRGCCDTSAEEIIKARHQLTIQSADILGLPNSHIHCLAYPDGAVAAEHCETERLQALINDLEPLTIFVPHHGEGWNDHVCVKDIVKKIINKDTIDIYEYCVWIWYYNVWNLDRKNARILKLSKIQHKRRLRAIGQYTTPLAPCGKPWSGVLPKAFLKAARWNKELYFKAK